MISSEEVDVASLFERKSYLEKTVNCLGMAVTAHSSKLVKEEKE